MAPHFRGIYRLTEQLSASTFKALRVSGVTARLLNQSRTVHVLQIKLYVPPSSPVAHLLSSLQGETSSTTVPDDKTAIEQTQPQRQQRVRHLPRHLRDFVLE